MKSSGTNRIGNNNVSQHKLPGRNLLGYLSSKGISVRGLSRDRLKGIPFDSVKLEPHLKRITCIDFPPGLADPQLLDIFSLEGESCFVREGNHLKVALKHVVDVLEENQIPCLGNGEDWRGGWVTPRVEARLSQLSAVLIEGRIEPEIFISVEKLEGSIFNHLLIIGQIGPDRALELAEELHKTGEEEAAYLAIDYFVEVYKDWRFAKLGADWALKIDAHEIARDYYWLAHRFDHRRTEFKFSAIKADKKSRKGKKKVKREKMDKFQKTIDAIKVARDPGPVLSELLREYAREEIEKSIILSVGVYKAYHLFLAFAGSSSVTEIQDFEDRAMDLLEEVFNKAANGFRVEANEERLIREVVDKGELIFPDHMKKIEQRSLSNGRNHELCKYIMEKLFIEQFNRAADLTKSDPEKALELIRLSEEAYPDHAQLRKSISVILSKIGHRFMEKKENEAAREKSEEALEYNPDNPLALVVRANIHYDEAEYAEAINIVDKLLEFEPANVSNLAMKGLAYLALYLMSREEEHKKEGMAAFEKALSIDPNYLSAKYNRARFLLVSSDFENGMQATRDLIGDIGIDQRRLFVMIDSVLKSSDQEALQRDKEELKVFFQELVKLALDDFKQDPPPMEIAVYASDVAGSMTRIGFEDLGLQVMNFFIENFPDRKDLCFIARYNLAVGLYESEKYKKAGEIFSELIDDPLGEDNYIFNDYIGSKVTFRENIFNFLALAYKESARSKKTRTKKLLLERALQVYKKAVQIYPGNIGFLNSIAVVSEELGDDETAEEYYLACISKQKTFLLPYLNIYSLYNRQKRSREAGEIAGSLLERVKEILSEADPDKLDHFRRHDFYWLVFNEYLAGGKKEKRFLEMLMALRSAFPKVLEEAAMRFSEQKEHRGVNLPDEILSIIYRRNV